MPRDVIVPDSDQTLYDNFHFAPAVRTKGGLVICSGVIGGGEDGKVPEDAKEEFRNAWRGVAKVLAEAGLGLEHVQEYTTFHVDLQAHLADFMAVRDEVLEAPWPAWTAIGVTALAIQGARCEIRVVAEG